MFLESPTIRAIVDKLAEYFNVNVERAIVNLYKDERDYVSFHHDQDYAGNDYMTIGASFGFERNLDFVHVGEAQFIRKHQMKERTGHHYKGDKPRFSIPQFNGDVFAFTSTMNRAFMHSIPRVKGRKCGPRYSVIVWGKMKGSAPMKR